MPQINLITPVNAPIKRCFDLSRSIDLHKLSTASTGEEAVAGITTGLIRLNETVTWRAKHFGLWFCLTSKIIKMDVPYSFTDEMIKGPFESMLHHHHFESAGSKTIMRDEFRFTSPYGWAGKLADNYILSGYLKTLLQKRNETIVLCAEGNDWQNYLNY